jgi:hypothetical protein
MVIPKWKESTQQFIPTLFLYLAMLMLFSLEMTLRDFASGIVGFVVAP